MKVIGCFFKLYLTFTIVVIPFQPVLAQEFLLAESPPVILEQKNPELELALFKEQKEPWRAVALNLIPLGVGSFQQGDYFSGIVIAVFDCLGIYFLTQFFTAKINSDAIEVSNDVLEIIGRLFVGSLALFFSRLLGFYTPFLHYESELKAFIQKQENEFSNSNQIPETLSLLNLTYTF